MAASTRVCTRCGSGGEQHMALNGDGVLCTACFKYDDMLAYIGYVFVDENLKWCIDQAVNGEEDSANTARYIAVYGQNLLRFVAMSQYALYHGGLETERITNLMQHAEQSIYAERVEKDRLSTILAKVRRECDSLKAQQKTAAREHDSTHVEHRRQLDNLRRECESLKAQLQTARLDRESERDDDTNRLDASRRQCNSLTVQLRATTAECNNLRRTLNTICAERTSEAMATQEARTGNATLCRKLVESTRKCDLLEAEQQTIIHELTSRYDKLKNEFDKVDNERELAILDVTKMKTATTVVQGKFLESARACDLATEQLHKERQTVERESEFMMVQLQTADRACADMMVKLQASERDREAMMVQLQTAELDREAMMVKLQTDCSETAPTSSQPIVNMST
jgi:hypothetical protein